MLSAFERLSALASIASQLQSNTGYSLLQQKHSFNTFLSMFDKVHKVQKDTKGIEPSVHIMEVFVFYLLRSRGYMNSGSSGAQ